MNFFSKLATLKDQSRSEKKVEWAVPYRDRDQPQQQKKWSRCWRGENLLMGSALIQPVGWSCGVLWGWVAERYPGTKWIVQRCWHCFCYCCSVENFLTLCVGPLLARITMLNDWAIYGFSFVRFHLTVRLSSSCFATKKSQFFLVYLA